MDGQGTGGHCLFPLSAFYLVLFYWKVQNGVERNMDSKRWTERDAERLKHGGGANNEMQSDAELAINLKRHNLFLSQNQKSK